MKQSRLTAILSTCAFGILLAGCSETVSDHIVNLDQNTKGYRITCNGPVTGKGECYERAAEICTNKGYTVVNEGPLNGDWTANQYQTTVKCNK